MTKEDQLIQKIFTLANYAHRTPVVGLCGKGASGKSKLAKSINSLDLGVVDVSMDWWFHQSTDQHRHRIAEARASKNPNWIHYCENPYNRINWVQFEKDFQEFQDTGFLKRDGLYNKATGFLDLSINLAISDSAPRMIMLEGFLAHVGPSKNYMDFLVVLNIPSDVLYQRRLKRERHRKSEEEILARHELEEEYITPHYERIVEGPRLMQLNVDELENLHARFKEMPTKPVPRTPARADATQFAL